MSERVAATRSCAHPTSNARTSWEGIAEQLTLLNHPRMAAFDLILLVTYMRPSELLALRKKDIVPPLGPLLTCWSVVIATSEVGVSIKAEFRDGSVLMDQRWFQ